MTLRRHVWMGRDHEAASRRAAALVARTAARVRERLALVVPGGSTPRRLFELLAEGTPTTPPWKRVHVFWADERCVPPADPASNFGLAAELLLEHVPIPPANVHRIRGEEPPEEAARLYREELKAFFGGELPAFDVAVLGFGDDGHTCSLFPGSPALVSGRAAEAVRAPTGIARRVTLTPAGLSRTGCILFLVTGEQKAGALGRTLRGRGDARALPARSIRARRVVWIVDEAAGAELG